ncbi:MAG TPA: FAD-dependent oxidoreductase [Candidatus Methylomirabilis sp.]|nr:FAD-dependent oxidoreductase [Candidatus Methylomirabilis sp.]
MVPKDQLQQYDAKVDLAPSEVDEAVDTHLPFGKPSWPRLLTQRDYIRATDRLYAAAAREWRTLKTVLAAELGVRLGGGLMVAETPDELISLEGKSRLQRPFGIETDILTPQDLLAMAPNLSDRLAGASYCPHEGFANPLLVTPAYLRAAVHLGARIRRGTRVRSIERAGPGGFSVQTSAGVVQAHRIVCAAGAQTPEVVGMVGLELPIVPHPLQVMATEPWPPVLTQVIQHAGRQLSLRQTPHRTFVIGGGWPALADGPDGRLRTIIPSILGNSCVARDVLPCLDDVQIVRAWPGMTTATGTRNRVGILGEYERAPGFFVVVAGGWGFALSPVLSQLTAELVGGGTPSLPIEEFGLARCASRA